MRYIWPYYLPSNSTAACTFFQPAVETILSRLRDSHILESCTGAVAKPFDLKSVSLHHFASPDGIPFTLGPQTEARYLSLRYPPWAVEATSSIGVTELSPQEFLQDLSALIASDEDAFYARSADWHSHLAMALFKLVADTGLMAIIMEMPIIPLHSGRWISAQGQSIFFSRAGSSLDIPSGIDVLVDAKAESDPPRRKLFATLGVKDWEVSEICRLVLQVHTSQSFEPISLTTAQLVSHAKFLWKASWQPPKDANLWFATTQDKRCLGKDLYIFGSAATGSAAARVFARMQDEFPVIHSDYLETNSSDSPDGDWHDWLVLHLKLARVPRLVTPHVDPKPQPVESTRLPSENRPVPMNPGNVATGSYHVLLDYQAQLILLEQKNKKVLMEARRQDGALPLPPPPTGSEGPNPFHEDMSDFDFDSFLHDDGLALGSRISDFEHHIDEEKQVNGGLSPLGSDIDAEGTLYTE